MKTLIKAIALTAILSTQVFALAPTITQKDCIELHGFAGIIMRFKADGMEMSKALGGEPKNPVQAMRKMVVVDAYSTRTYNSDDLNVNAAANFSAKWLKACMGAIK